MISFKDISLTQGSFNLSHIDFDLQENQHYCLAGKTGSGKTTLLEILCGLRKPDSGEVWINGQNVTHWAPADRSIGYVPQQPTLFPHLNVAANLGFALKIRKVSAKVIRQKVEEMAKLLGIAHLLAHTPSTLSGGERQRVALGRALIFDPCILCLDEPFSALDKETKMEMYQLLQQLKKAYPVTVLHISHSLNEMKMLADYVLCLSEGKVQLEEVTDYVNRSFQV